MRASSTRRCPRKSTAAFAWSTCRSHPSCTPATSPSGRGRKPGSPSSGAPCAGLAFPEAGFGDWRRALVRAAEDVHRTKQVDIALGTASPSVDFIPGWHLNRSHRVPSIMDYRDAWTIDVFTGGRSPRATRRSERWESRLISAADQIWFVNEPIREWHSAKYPLSRPAGCEWSRTASTRSEDYRRPFRLWRPKQTVRSASDTSERSTAVNFLPRVLLAGWTRARERSPQMARARLVLRGHLGRTAPSRTITWRSSCAAARRSVSSTRAPWQGRKIREVYTTFDALVLALASGPGVTSGKVFEFAATGLPVVSVHDPSSAASAVMAGSPVWSPTSSMAADDIAAALIAGAEQTRMQTPQSRDAAIAWGAQWERGRQLEAGVDGVEQLLAAGGDR